MPPTAHAALRGFWTRPRTERAQRASASWPGDLPADHAQPCYGVIVVDDHALTRRQLASVIDAHSRLYMLGTAANGHDALHLVVATDPDVVVMDIRMPGLDGLRVAERIRQLGDAAVVLMSSFEDRQYEAAAAGAGAFACVSKAAREQDLLGVIVAAGESRSAS
jgi:DNA-binding NarL/FixJ family response regulator